MCNFIGKKIEMAYSQSFKHSPIFKSYRVLMLIFIYKILYGEKLMMEIINLYKHKVSNIFWFHTQMISIIKHINLKTILLVLYCQNIRNNSFASHTKG